MILTATWCFAAYCTDSHQSSWCLANVAQIITMLADPFFFPLHEAKKKRE
jgi:hypothetical protein